MTQSQKFVKISSKIAIPLSAVLILLSLTFPCFLCPQLLDKELNKMEWEKRGVDSVNTSGFASHEDYESKWNLCNNIMNTLAILGIGTCIIGVVSKKKEKEINN